MNSQEAANQANQILNNPAFTAAIEAVKKAYIDKILTTASDDDEGRKKYYMCVHALADVQAALTGMIQNGKIDLEREQKKEKARK